jgi:adenine-specific DNA-methyltransferase
MTKNKQKLELRWHGKDDWESPEPRLLIEKNSYQSKKKGIDDNLLIYGDNLLGLKSLERKYTGKVKCIYIDPPYNTKSCFTHYKDNLEHSLWLNMMKERLIILHRLLKDDGSIWISIDDSECHYLKVLCDEIFGRKNFISSVIWEKTDSPRMDAKLFSNRHDYLLVYSKNIEKIQMGRIERSEKKTPKHFNKVDNKGRRYYLKPLRSMGVDGTREARPSMYYSITAPDGTAVFPKNQDGSDSRWRWGKDRLQKNFDQIAWIKGKKGWSANSKIYADTIDSQPSETIWNQKEVGTNRTSKAEVKQFNSKDIFPTPKPERLLERILHLATNPGDLVLDCFAGSGTTGAVAHKMKRRWIMIEFNGPCHSHIIPRMEKVIEGKDEGGITKQVKWNGGGGFKYFEMAPSLMEKNRLGRWTINKKYNPAMLSEAVCMHANYQYAPRKDPYWMHGYSTENDFIYVTARTLTRVDLSHLSDDVGEDRSLMIYCEAFKDNGREYENLTVRKIPKAILNKCTWGKDDYSLKIALSKEVKSANSKKRKRNTSTSKPRTIRSKIAAHRSGR